MPPRLAYIVSPHGFGHASRSAAVLAALREARPELEIHIFSTVPAWFWDDSLDGPFELHEVVVDVGLAQRSPLEEDLAATLQRLDTIRPLDDKARPLAALLTRLDAALVVCDISPLGLLAACQAGIPSVLVENFTWDWIYTAYFDEQPALRAVAAEMAEAFGRADLRVQTEPVCRAVPGSMVVPPVYRARRADRASVRARLEVEESRPLVLVSMGGFSWSFDGFEPMLEASHLTFAVFADVPRIERCGNVITLPYRSPIFHPDLLAAADVMVGKLGYSTVAEAWSAGCRYLYVPRPRFPEHPYLAAFVREHLPTLEVDAAAFDGGDWVERLADLLREPRRLFREPNGAVDVAALLAERLS